MGSPQLKTDPFGARDTFNAPGGKAGIYRLSKLQDASLGNISALPYSPRPIRSKVPSSRPASCFRTSPAYRASWISQPCALP
jgi:hypothetical protein